MQRHNQPMQYINILTASLFLSLNSCSKADEKQPTPASSTPQPKQDEPPKQLKAKNVTGELQVLSAQISLYDLLAMTMDRSADDLQRISPGPGVAAGREGAKKLFSIKADLEKIQATLKSDPDANLRSDYVQLISKVKQTEENFRATFLVRLKQDESNFSSWFKGLQKSQLNLTSIIDGNYPPTDEDKKIEAENVRFGRNMSIESIAAYRKAADSSGGMIEALNKIKSAWAKQSQDLLKEGETLANSDAAQSADLRQMSKTWMSMVDIAEHSIKIEELRIQGGNMASGDEKIINHYARSVDEMKGMGKSVIEAGVRNAAEKKFTMYAGQIATYLPLFEMRVSKLNAPVKK